VSGFAVSNTFEIAEESFSFGQALALLVQSGVCGMVVLLEAVERLARGPVVQRQVAVGMVEAAEQFGAEVVGALAEELGPRAVGTVSFFERGYGFGLDLKFPEGKISIAHSMVLGLNSLLKSKSDLRG